jgi:hypothetical protein
MFIITGIELHIVNAKFVALSYTESVTVYTDKILGEFCVPVVNGISAMISIWASGAWKLH